MIDFDVLGVNEIRTRTINLTNSNPVKVDINWMETDVEGLVIKLDSVWNSHGYATSGRLLEANKQKSATDSRAYVVTGCCCLRAVSYYWFCLLTGTVRFSEDAPFLVLEPGNSAVFTVELSSSMYALTRTCTTAHANATR